MYGFATGQWWFQEREAHMSQGLILLLDVFCPAHKRRTEQMEILRHAFRKYQAAKESC